MNKMPKDNLEFVRHIVDAIKLINAYADKMNKKEFFDDKKTQDAVLREITVIGEAAKNVSEEFRKKTSYVEWRDLAAIRDIMVHQYFRVDLDKVWETIGDLPELKRKLDLLFKKNE